MSNLNEEAAIRLLGKITLLLPVLEQNLSLQLDVKRTIDETLYDYEISSKCTDLVASDIEEKAQIYLACKRLEGFLSCQMPEMIKSICSPLISASNLVHPASQFVMENFIGQSYLP